MIFPSLQSFLYRNLAKPFLFLFDPEFDHNFMTWVGELFENQDWLISGLFCYQNPTLTKKVLGIKFDNPVGLAAGFDYDGHLAKAMRYIGFGFNTVGTVTARAYQGNEGKRLGRLPKSRSLLVNKGFKSEGADAVKSRLNGKNLADHTVGLSVGSSNLPSIDTVNKAINDYLYTFKLFRKSAYIKYFELNISCPNIKFKGAFYDPQNFNKLCRAVSKLSLKQPIFVKMPSEISFADSDKLVGIALKYNIRGFIFSNLVRDRNNKFLDRQEIASVSGSPGNFSGKPVFDLSNKLIAHTRKKFGNQVALIGTGGIFSGQDAKAKLDAGADLVQLITGMIYQGPQLIGQINKELASA